MDLHAYLDRLGHSEDVAPTLDTLRTMHRAHFWGVPFESLDISRGIGIQIDEKANFNKIVRRRRGGFCLEVTSLFARALRQIGFRVDLIGARMLEDGELGAPMSHMALIVHLDEPWIADVGFGGRILEPLRLGERDAQVFGDRRYVIANDGDHWFVTCIEPGLKTLSYVFTIQPREFEDFSEVCDWLQRSPESRFTHGYIVTRATSSGRNTLVPGRLITVHDGTRKEHRVPPGDERAMLRDRFGIRLD